jgi:5-methylthioadenosine/S-adenosylhomocysteine deaminase
MTPLIFHGTIAEMKTLIRNATILPMTGPEDVLHGSIMIEDHQIVAIGLEPTNFKADRIIDAKGMIAMPGLVNAHTHLGMVYFRNYRDSSLNLQEWLEEIWKLEAHLVEQDLYIASLLGIGEMIQSGTTTFADMYFFQAETIKAALDAKIKTNIGLTLFGDLKESKHRVATILPELQQMSDGSAIKIDIAPHAIYTCSGDTLRYAVEIAQQENCRFHIHASETIKEVEDSLATHKMSPIAYLASLGAFSVPNYLAHGVHLTADDYPILQNKHTSVVHNPSSNCKLASGIAPIKRMADYKIQLALGTDGASSNNTLDMFQEMRLSAMLAAISTEKTILFSPYDILQMATIGGATALGRAAECGTLEVGKDADIILINTDKAHLTPLNNIYSALVFAAKSSDVDTVLCRGELLMQNRVLQTIDIAQVMKKTQTIWEQMKKRN